MAKHVPFNILSRVVLCLATAVEEAAARRHLARCRRCRSEMEWLERLHAVPYGSNSPRPSWPAPRVHGLGQPAPSPDCA
jgi:hypothetical protein